MKNHNYYGGVLTPPISTPMCTCSFRMPIEYHEELIEVLKQWELLIGHSSVSQISRLIFSRGLLSFKNTQGFIDLENHIYI